MWIFQQLSFVSFREGIPPGCKLQSSLGGGFQLRAFFFDFLHAYLGGSLPTKTWVVFKGGTCTAKITCVPKIIATGITHSPVGFGKKKPKFVSEKEVGTPSRNILDAGVMCPKNTYGNPENLQCCPVFVGSGRREITVLNYH